MTWSLELRNGDLALGGSQLATVTGKDKLIQDLRNWILERMGTDPSHPGYGSLIDGGRRPDGVYVQGVIGEMDFSRVALDVEAEIRRIISDYQNQQLARAKDDNTRYGRATLTRSEALIGVSSIDITQQQDTMRVEVVIETAQGNLGFAFPINLTP